MARKAVRGKAKPERARVQQRGRPKAAALPGMEDHAIKALEDVAEEYSEIRDQRMDLTEREHALKIHAMRLMRKHDKTIYRHNGVEIIIVPGEDDVKVRVKKAEDDDETAPPPAGPLQTDERRQAVDAAEGE